MVRAEGRISMPARDDCVMSAMIEKFAAQTPTALFALFEDGSSWTYAQTRDLTARTAAGLAELGVKRGDFVHVWLPNGPDAIRIWFGINWLGAIFVPINLAYKGNLLAHVIGSAGARLIVTDPERFERLGEIDRAQLSDAVLFGDTELEIPGLRKHGPSSLFRECGIEPADTRPSDPQMVIFTSGTTGPSKGVLMSSMHSREGGRAAWPPITPDDRFLLNLPLFHVSGVGPIQAALANGASFAQVSGFSTSNFWDVVRSTGCTAVVLMGVMATFLMKQPPAAGDRDHSLRIVLMVPLAEDSEAFSARFGVTVHTIFNMTETSTPLVGEPNPSPIGSCGRARAGVEVRLVDDEDWEVPQGEIGELIVRTRLPWAMNSGYLNDPEATSKAWRNGWFHTGDLFRQDEAGNFFFVDRAKDSIRRRGENISSFEVEAEVCAHSAVREAAAVAVPSDVGEDEVLVAVALNEGASLDPADLIRFLVPRTAHFMVPRYIRLFRELPKTPTSKVQKHLLREEGVTADTFDRERAGLIFRRGEFVDNAAAADDVLHGPEIDAVNK